MISQETREQYIALKKQVDEAYAAAEPERQAYEAAMVRYHELELELGVLVEDTEVELCEGCGALIFEGDHKCYVYDGGYLCVACSPTYQDLLNEPGNFRNGEGEAMSALEANSICEAHVENGGALTDIYP